MMMNLVNNKHNGFQTNMILTFFSILKKEIKEWNKYKRFENLSLKVENKQSKILQTKDYKSQTKDLTH